jgi:hypothetical protein
MTDNSSPWGGSVTGLYLRYTTGPAAGQYQLITYSTSTTVTTAAFSPAPTPGGGDTYEILFGGPYGIEESSSADKTTWTPQADADVAQSPDIGYDLATWFSLLTNTVRYVTNGGGIPIISGITTTGTIPTVMHDTSLSLVPNAYIGYGLAYDSGPASGQSASPVTSNTATTVTCGNFSPAPTPTGGDNFHIYNPQCRYRVGTPQSDGSIIWLKPEQILPFNVSPTTVITDKLGYDWICGSNHVYSNANTDGTWSTDVSYTIPAVDNRASIVPLYGSNIVAAVYTTTASHNIKIAYYDGASWTVSTATTHGVDNSTGGAAGFSAVTISDMIHIAFVTPTGDIVYARFDTDLDFWAEETVIVSTGSVNSRPMVSEDFTGRIFVFYPNTTLSQIEFLVRSGGGAWTGPTIFTPYVGAFPTDERFASSWDSSGSYIVVTFLAASGVFGAPWKVWAGFLNPMLV